MTTTPDSRIETAPAKAAADSALASGGASGSALAEEPRYQVLLTDFSGSLANVKALVAEHTRIPVDEIDQVLRERPAVLADAVTRTEADRLVAAFRAGGANAQTLARSMPGIENALDDFIFSSDALTVLLMDRSGFKICERGQKGTMDVDLMLGLIAGVFAATKRIANHLGEDDFSALFHPGNSASIHLSLVGDRGVMVTQFDKRTTMRIIRLYAVEAAKRIAAIL